MFSYKTLEELRAAAGNAGVELPLAEDVSCLAQRWTAGTHAVKNRIVIQPMEGCDSEPDGTPAAPTRRRYLRLAAGGAGLIWLEACAVCREGRANPHQLWIREENLDAFRRLADDMREAAVRETGEAPVLLLQLTHSGRYAKPEGVPAPRIAYNNPLFEKDAPLPASCIVTDEEIEAAEDNAARAAVLAQRAGFDGVDIKASHRYLGSELLSAYTRPGKYGGSFENRTRYLRNALSKAQQAVTGDFWITSRLNAYDGFPYPYGFGVREDGSLEPDLEEPIRLLRLLRDELHLSMVNITIGNPYVNPHVNRPADWQPYPLPEEPLRGVARMLSCVGGLKRAVPELQIVGSALSYPRQFAGNLAAGAVEAGLMDAAGFGRLAFAYPEFARDLLSGRGLDRGRCCVTCGKCSQLMRMGSRTGCVVRDPEYTELYKELTKK
ncbi:MAG: flavin oxidoreductase/NADH oxidase [Candidatus Spyradocola sp.]|jgi:2,4-dienoyl-CoA reductase-like NADH-dependent reductase (Old Yellow Enzyme family)